MRNAEMVTYHIGQCSTQFELRPWDTVERIEWEVTAILLWWKDRVSPTEYYESTLKSNQK